MDNRGIPIVLPGNKYSSPRRNTKLTPLRHDVSSPFLLPSTKNEPSLLEVYDAFADACFQSHYNHSILNDYSILDFYKSEIYPTDNTRFLPPKEIKAISTETTETKVPELQTSLTNSKIIRSSTFSEEETITFESPLLAYTTQVAQENSKEEISTDAQLANFSDMALNTTDNMSIVADPSTANSAIVTGSSTSDKSITDSNIESDSKPIRKNKVKIDPPTTRLTRSQRKLLDTGFVSLPTTPPTIRKPRIVTKKKLKEVNDSKKEEEVTQSNNTEQEMDLSKRIEYKREMEKQEIKAITDNFPGLSHYYEFVERAGRGTFSKVYKAKDLLVNYYAPIESKHQIKSSLEESESNYVAIKLVFDISSPVRVAEEIRFLMMFRDSPCITPLITAFRHEPYTYLVLPYINFDHFDDIYYDMTLSDVRCYISQLLIALNCVHEKGVMHRDVKPGNFLYNNKTKIGYLADFGLAQRQMTFQREHTGQPPNNQYTENADEAGYYVHDQRGQFRGARSGTKGFRAPEVLLKYLNQTTSIDIWAVGVILLIILSGKYPFFNPDDDSDAMMELAHVFGMKNLKEFVEFYGRSIKTNIPDIPEEGMDLKELCQKLNKDNVDKWDPEEFSLAIDLLKHCLVLIHTNRYTAIQALNHPFIKR